MTGAIIPDDWDGETYKCWKVQWPDSADYSAILLGNISKPSFLDYWDPDTGDAQEAANAIKAAYNQTLPGFWAEDCNMLPSIDNRAFKVYNSVVQSVPATTWTQIEWDTFLLNRYAPGFNLAAESQDMTFTGIEGIWQYNAEIWLDTPADLNLELRLNGYRVIAAGQAKNKTQVRVSTSFYVDPTWTSLSLWIYTTVAGDTIPVLDYSPTWTGFLARPVDT